MARVHVAYRFVLRDVDGQQAVMVINNDSTGDTATLATLKANSDAINATIPGVTNAKVIMRSVTLLVDEAQGVGLDAQFPLVSQKATLHFANAQGSRASVSIPAPLEAIFKAPPSDDLVDPAQAGAAAFIAAFQAAAGDVGNNALNLFEGGALSSRHRSRRRSIHTA